MTTKRSSLSNMNPSDATITDLSCLSNNAKRTNKANGSPMKKKLCNRANVERQSEQEMSLFLVVEAHENKRTSPREQTKKPHVIFGVKFGIRMCRHI